MSQFALLWKMCRIYFFFPRVGNCGSFVCFIQCVWCKRCLVKISQTVFFTQVFTYVWENLIWFCSPECFDAIMHTSSLRFQGSLFAKDLWQNKNSRATFERQYLHLLVTGALQCNLMAQSLLFFARSCVTIDLGFWKGREGDAEVEGLWKKKKKFLNSWEASTASRHKLQ